MDEIDRKALRTVAHLAWERRDALQLTPAETDQVLIAWMAVGTEEEGEAASALLAARKTADRKQANFDRLLKAAPTA